MALPIILLAAVLGAVVFFVLARRRGPHRARRRVSALGDRRGAGPPGSCGRRGSRLRAALIAVAAFAAVLAPASAAKPGLATGFAEQLYLHSDSEVRKSRFSGRSRAGRDRALQPPLALASPRCSRSILATRPIRRIRSASLTRPIRAAVARGLQPLIMIYHAPDLGRGRRPAPSGTPGGHAGSPTRTRSATSSTRLRRAIPAASAPASAAGDATSRLWNEPNLAGYLTPQCAGQATACQPGHLPRHAERLLRGDQERQPATTSWSPAGPPRTGTRPVTSARGRWTSCATMLCLRADAAQADRMHAEGELRRPRPPPDQHLGRARAKRASTPTTPRPPTSKLRPPVLRAAERAGHGAGGPHQLWATEIWWESNPPDGFRGQSARHARPAGSSRRSTCSWQQGAPAWCSTSQVRDAPVRPRRTRSRRSQSGHLLQRRLTPKPSATGLRLPVRHRPPLQDQGLRRGASPQTAGR